MRKKGFTLIELLVVISIIALLMAILMPALSKARNQAKLVIDMANSKQIGTVLMVFKAENSDYVPILLNQHSQVPAKSRFLSLALRDHVQLGDSLDPEGFWGPAQLDEYFNSHIKDYYACPFVRNKASETTNTTGIKEIGSITLKGSAGSHTFKSLVYEGKRESYEPSLWWLKQDWEYTKNHPYGEPHGTAKYGSYRWFDDSDLARGWGSRSGNAEYLKLKRIRWSPNLAQHTGSRSASENIAFFCNAGQWDSWSTSGGGIVNYGSHKKGRYGGTVATFADGSVQWVEGTRIGWH
ncbi:PilD-dependent protein PddA [Limihaloglobus sulfuriphilus]|uniref:PilD-dependent protein PddA n=1 Tax=Limihaloglobus sulfuriphilus TaxID=1851148 RepID=A0A1Q2MFK3_9BACT|nr:type II secretion system protein [Limihaloglobus sulfuriphilus]AQQ71476.1 PilD-dependent protein PddA [Limihaloglobus sulfuriphilus]